MPSLRQLLDRHGSALVLDAAATSVQVGWLRRDTAPAWTASEDEAGIALFTGIEQLGVDLNAIEAFIFCEGPGSILGIRTAATALRTWTTLRPRAVYTYQSLDLVAQALNRPEVTIIADARRQLWHAQVVGQPLRRVPKDELTAPLLMPAGFRHWSELPPEVETTPYDLAALFASAVEVDLLRPCDEPDAFLHSDPEYKTWTPQVHRAP
jgi:tRNA threonylcarbamoyladenosine biosynthesis protein TsaB